MTKLPYWIDTFNVKSHRRAVGAAENATSSPPERPPSVYMPACAGMAKSIANAVPTTTISSRPKGKHGTDQEQTLQDACQAALPPLCVACNGGARWEFMQAKLL
jgi:hypothetical protein